MIGQHKRSLEHCVSFPPAKCLKHQDEALTRKSEDEFVLESGGAEDEVVDIDPSDNFQHHHHKFFQVRFDDSSTEACLKGYTDVSSEPTRDNSSSQEISSLELCFPVQESSISSPAPSRFFQAALEGLLPRIKGVPIGPDYQAEVPHWDPDKHKEVDEEEEAWIGERVWPPSSPEEIQSSCDDSERVGKGRSQECGCEDRGSVECARRHVDESREKVAREVGALVYVKLGLEEMGECVSRRWTEQEEKIFGEVVRLNPASQRRNFWTPLRYAFPSRRRRELVSYYFNVFVLRRRALQNRFDRENVDSDDDESDLPPPPEEEDWESEYTDEEEVVEAVAGGVREEEEEEEEEELEEEDGEEEEEKEEQEQQGEVLGTTTEFLEASSGGGGGGGDEFEKFSSKDGGGFAREETEKEILRLSRALSQGEEGWIAGEMELASTNGAMQEFFGREGDGIVSWERSS
ncbi:uncharacterized protein LOC112345440 isoform X1 [Selaginella moellendorffii]|uniref:uncharacterized protein LOC112345440 isoform X1 n=1 Tax=Selaginella moellendorffii TaxID=88036 RepID=UPI000D1D0946|nr:uncharacterized protein LOC112345440 isoform X1 [Selaginella moellendorffii]|eukprot:XP_024527947.1 uncharacterized protein LOC112345440 isoform X1 [Selaginella moellendorffii]